MPGEKRNFWIELKRRSVYHVATIYLVTAWIVIQAAVAIFPSLNVPGWILSLLIKVVILGFPVSLIFSWIFEVTRQGIEVTRFDRDIESDEETRKIYVTSMVLFGILAAFVIGFTYYAFFSERDDFLGSNSEVPVVSSVSEVDIQSNSIAVLPFRNQSSQDDQQFFADGIRDDILAKLFQIEGLLIKSGTSTEKFRNHNSLTPDIAQELKVANIIEGSVQPVGERVRIRVSLIDGQTDNQKWGGIYDEPLSDILKIQAEIAEEVAQALAVTVSPDVKKRIEFSSTENPEVNKLYWRAQYTEENSDDFELAEQLIDQALSIDANFAPGYAFKGYLWLARGTWQGTNTPAEVIAQAEPLLTKAVQINPDYPLTYVYLALLKLWFEWDFEGAELYWNEFHRLSPSNPPDPGFIDFLNAAGRFVEAETESIKIMSIDDLSSLNWSTSGLSFYFNGKVDQAVAHYEEALNYFPQVASIATDAARAFLYAGEYKKVLDVLHPDELDLENAPSRSLGNLAIAYFHLGNRELADRILDILINRSENSTIGSPAFYAAMILAQMNQKEEAFKFLQRAFDNHEVEMFWLNVEPPFEPLRDDLRWFGLLQKVGFPS